MSISVNHSLAGKRVFVGLSGGVDSAVTAALLKEAGAKVTGVFIKGWYPPGLPCTWAADRRDAMRVAARLQIPFTTLDASAEYKAGVIEYLLRDYRAGRTPNPDIMCNREVKFGAFFRYARSQGADYIATGHYARVEAGRLYRGTDSGKDQSYFLWAVPSEALQHTLFPLGGKRKAEVRALAKHYKLPNAEKRDSQGICFLGSISVEEFLRSEFGDTPGIAVDEEGAVIGAHDGVLLHTLGSRVPLRDAPPGPWYVIQKDIGTNTLVVAKQRDEKHVRAGIALSESVTHGSVRSGSCTAQYRYHGPLIAGTYDEKAQTFAPSELLPEPAAAGQSLVIYDGDELIAGGIIAG